MAGRALVFLAAVGLAACCGCASGVNSPLASVDARTSGRQAGGPSGGRITHIVIIVQENRSFENFFAGYPGANAPMSGCAEMASPRKSTGSGSGNCPYGDVQVQLKQITFDGPDLPHDYHQAKVDYRHGKMDGFSEFGKHYPYEAYSYVNHALIAPYWSMAQQYVLADNMYPTEWGGSFTGHLTLVAGMDTIRQKPFKRSEVDFPDGIYDDCDSPPGTRSSYITQRGAEHYYQGPFPCFDQFNTIAESLDAAGISWKYYATKVLDDGMWEPFEAIKYVRYGPDWNNVIAPQTEVLGDADDGQLAAVNWVTPSKDDSDHPHYHSDKGPSWVASIVNSIGESPYWSNTAIIVLWDDWGGWYDNANPPQLDYRGLGFRVPCLIISPYAKQGYVSHVLYEYGSVLRFIEETFSLAPIGPISKDYTDQRAASLDDAFDFAKSPRPFAPIPTKYGISVFKHEKPSNDPIDTQ